ncbi:glycoside hydrolase family 3 protein [Treponema phagedenis]|uniref:glycoside hydrolase family 3 protein n=1 Tax=Treponema phagedenis TaxID=162 RepID=UPI0001F63AA6|nr:glycoside hydrolase family 3 N-terminal domain-containing protein [Treponema phagedenis]EFW38883.1 glycosyl hydrolase family 3 N-terminal domain protein [Treponema phagedenis F0421]TYT78752.1 glycoside hydrolase family 3 protein [Treponema phagedenis]
MSLVDLRAKPYFLTEEDIRWVETTIQSMSLEEKIGQLFFQLFHSFEEAEVIDFINTYHLGGARYSAASSEKVQGLVKTLQSNAKIPLFVACNCDSGGDGACTDGTYIASGAQCEASGDPQVAYNAGYVSGAEAVALGCNWNFDPCADILTNWRNTIVNTRAYGTNADTVLRYILPYVKGLRQSTIISTIKHFPGDGTEERDQHLVLGVNEMSVQEWDASFGKLYKAMIDDGIMSIMAGHIALPQYSRALVPEMTYDEIMPATLAPELIQDLLKKKLGFNGLVITDASHMLGFSAAMQRKDAVPRAIAAGCDMFLFMNDPAEDFQYMLQGYKNGVITEERLTDALRRILGLKAAIKLHTAKAENRLLPSAESLSVIGCAAHKEMAREAADKGITLVKNTLGQLPLSPSVHKRIRLYFLDNTEIGVYTEFDEKGNPIKTENKTLTLFKKELEAAGFIVDVNTRGVREKGSVETYKETVDAALVVSDIRGYAVENNYRIRWSCAMANEIPWYVWEVPTVFVSLNYTTHLTDVPMVKAYINAYARTPEIIHQVVQKIIGASPFKGTYNENVWCNKWETRR